MEEHVEVDGGEIMKTAYELCQEDSRLELKKRGVLPPCRKISPLSPPLSMDEYHMMERDKGKCLVNYNAVLITCSINYMQHTSHTSTDKTITLPHNFRSFRFLATHYFYYTIDLLYWTAISKAIGDIISNKIQQKLSVPAQPLQPAGAKAMQFNGIITCLVFGAGLGRLVQFCIDAMSDGSADCHHLFKADVHAVDANPLAVDCLKNYFSDYASSEGLIKVTVHPNYVLFPGLQKEDLPCNLRSIYRNCDLIVSELLGCFGCDEFLPELTSTLCNLFLKTNAGICIPNSWQSYIAPIQSYSLYNSLLSDMASSTYTVGIPSDCIFMSEPKILWKGSCRDYQTPCNLDGVKFSYSPFMVKESHEITKLKSHVKNTTNNNNNTTNDPFVIHGIIGYFTSCLYDDIYIDTRHCSERNSYHWECFYMPIKQPLSLALHASIVLDDACIISVLVKRACGIVVSDNGIWSSSNGTKRGTCLSLNYSWKIELLHVDSKESFKLLDNRLETGNMIYLTY